MSSTVQLAESYSVDLGDNEGMNELGKGRLKKELLDLGKTPQVEERLLAG